jgi:1-hydroxycarotenoid 3,4-desaturase
MDFDVHHGNGTQDIFWADKSVMYASTHQMPLYPGTGGALYGPAAHGWQAAFNRPGARTKLPGLYLAGGSTHPGAGLAMAALSGRAAAAQIIGDMG